MSRLREALAWSSTDVTLSMFVISSKVITPDFIASLPGLPPQHVRSYDLEDEIGVLGGRHVREFDLKWTEMPDQLEEIVRTCLKEIMAAGAEVAWFGFEGSFDYQHLLHPDTADQVYAVGVSGEMWVAMEDERRGSNEWKTLLNELRGRVL